MTQKSTSGTSEFYGFEVLDSKNKKFDLNTLKGKAVLVVNVASKCGLTPQYEGLEKLYEKYSSQGLMVLGFPCNQFGAQEPGSNAEIQEFCTLNYAVKFPIMAKIDVNGASAHPLYNYLKSHTPPAQGNEDIKWNFAKFLISKDGQILSRFAPTVTPQELEPEIKKAL